MHQSCIVAASAAALACVAHAGVDRFTTVSTIMAGTPEQEVGAFGNSFSTLVADVDTSLFGRVVSTLATSATEALMTSSMTIIGGHMGKSMGDALYVLAQQTTVRVDWSWSRLQQTGGWSIRRDTTTTPLAALDFSNSVFTTTGGAWSKSATGTAFVTVSAGTYIFGATFNARTMPATSSVRFTFVPGPAPIALLGLAGMGPRRRRT